MYQTTFRELSFPPVSNHQPNFEWKEQIPANRRPNHNPPFERDGLQTPPPDDMSGAHPNQPYLSHDPNQLSVYSANKVSSNTQLSNTQVRQSTTVNLPPLSAGVDYRDDRPRFQSWQTWEQHQNLPASHAPEVQSRKKNVNGSDASRTKLQIPNTISPDGGSLSDFAAQITCLFWFESIEKLLEAEGINPISSIQSLRPEAIPCVTFKKWVSTILSTTQVTDKVIILALLFIYRLKKYNSSVKGRSGSEYRLFTVALMLGNKFLDDNTYTNNTWAEVSGISVQEIHVMEVEFLSNMRYSLVASKEQWEEWHRTLSLFKQYCDTALRASVVPKTLPPMPSPPETIRTSPLLNNQNYAQMDTQLARQWPMYSSLSSTATSALPKPYYTRKRSLEKEIEEPAVKKVMMGPNGSRNQNSYGISKIQKANLPRLPNFPPKSTGTTSLNVMTGPGSTHIVLPPIGPPPQTCSRMTANICTPMPTTPSWPPQIPYPASGSSCPQPNSLRLKTSPQNHSSVHEILSYNSSPISANYTGRSGHISPSIFLQQRTSPYKPVRHVNTLLYPPPFSSIHENSVNVEEMKYRPLGKRNENLRTGVVPHWPAHWQPHLRE